MSRAKGIKYGPVECCIYCGSTSPPLTAEHIVPANLGGDIVLEEASCAHCQKEINDNVEAVCMQRMFRDIRYRLGIGSRRLNKRPKKLKSKTPIDWERDKAKIDKPSIVGLSKFEHQYWKADESEYDEHPTLLVLPVYNAPGFLRRIIPRGHSGHHFHLAMWQFVQKPKKEPKQPTYVEVQFSHEIFLRLVAKIAHGYATYRYGAGGFDPFLTDFILGKKFPDVPYFLGGDPVPKPPNGRPYWLTVSRLSFTGIIQVRVRLFANVGAPTYLAIVGKHRPDRARLKPYDRLDGK